MYKILVCHTGAWIGDMVLLTPALRALKQAYPDSSLTFLMRPHVADLMQTNPYVDNCILDRKTDDTNRSFIELYRRIRENQFDIAVVLHPSSFRNVLLPFIARIPIRVGSNYKGRKLFLTSSYNDNANIHEVDRYLQVIQLLRKYIDPETKTNTDKQYKTTSYLEYWHTDQNRESLFDLLNKQGVSTEDRLMVVNLGTTWRSKQWNLRNFSDVIKYISDSTPEIKIVLIGSTDELNLVEQLELSDSTINLVGKTDLMQLGALLERCDVCLTSDSGPMHIAASVGTPTVALFGPTDPKRHKPYGKGHTVIEKTVSCRPCYKRTCHRQDQPYLCMEKIIVGEVVKSIMTILSQKIDRLDLTEEI